MVDPLQAEQLIEGILSGQRPALSRAITLIESTSSAHYQMAQAVLKGVLPHSVQSLRIGITGYPGAGKSSLIEAMGLLLIEAGHRVAVLAIDPSSSLSKGSILGDKTRMNQLSRLPQAYVRPSPSRGALGGVTRGTGEAVILCEAAGYDVILIETVGVGQSEIQVRDLVDCFVLVLLPGAGDQLQGVKRGIMEMADLLLINKADGEQLNAAKRTQSEYEMALHYLTRVTPDWTPPVLTCSAQTGQGLSEAWETIQTFQAQIQASGYFELQRQKQRESMFVNTLEAMVLQRFYQNAQVQKTLPQIRVSAGQGDLLADEAAQKLIEVYITPQTKDI